MSDDEKATEYRLSKPQQRAVLALVREKQELVEAIDEAIDELAALFGEKAGLPADGAGGQLVFFQAGPGAPLVLRFEPGPEEKEVEGEKSDGA
jgi:hypothetical protein